MSCIAFSFRGRHPKSCDRRPLVDELSPIVDDPSPKASCSGVSRVLEYNSGSV